MAKRTPKSKQVPVSGPLSAGKENPEPEAGTVPPDPGPSPVWAPDVIEPAAELDATAQTAPEPPAQEPAGQNEPATDVPERHPNDELIHRIARRAYERFLARGSKHGYDREDWMHAEEEFRDKPQD